MKIRALFAAMLLLAFATANLDAQTPQWATLPSPPAASRYDDLFFVSPQIGWAVHPYNTPGGWATTYEQGRIWKTTDGGDNWTLQLDSMHIYFRCIGFADTLHGWVCALGTFHDSIDQYYDTTTLMLETSDGGTTWQTPDKN